MQKEEFLNELRSALSGNVSADVINENMSYYEEYINTETRKGRDENDVMESLGDPRLIAKTIAETAPEGERRGPEYAEDEVKEDNTQGRQDVMPWWMIVIIIFAVMAAVSLAATIAGAVLPVLLPVIAVMMIVWLIRRR